MELNRTKIVLLTLLLLIAVAAGGVYALLTASLPRRAGSAELTGLKATVTIELDAHAVPRVRAESLLDAWQAQGYLHAQERFFQMDLMRRSVAGELSALFGARALQLDRAQRPFGYRARSAALAARLTQQQREWLQAYVRGVNAGLADLGARPPEYWLLGQAPLPWTVEDSLLVVYAFYTMLSNNESFEFAQAVMRDTLPRSLYEFLTPSATRFDRPLQTSAADPTGGYVPAPIPPPQDYDLRGVSSPRFDRPHVAPPLSGAASNNWAVDTRRSARGDAIVANDPHLRLQLPNVFYRSELQWPGGVARGVGIPGLPGILLGATDRIAWGATVSNADQSDWVIVEIDPANPDRYRVPEGSAAFEHTVHEIEIAGSAEPERLEVLSTRFGPIARHDWLGRPLALHATWLDDDGINLDILDIVFADNSDAAVEVLASWLGPSLNWLVADADGDIAWVANGPLPERIGFDGSVPESWADGARGWRGLQPPPRLPARADGTLFTANNRTLDLDNSTRLGRMWMRSTRAQRIAQLLDAQARFDESDFLRMQLDTAAQAYERIRALILEVVPASETDPLLSNARRSVADWNGRADPNERAFLVLHRYYLALLEQVLRPLMLPSLAADPEFVYRWPLADEAMRRLLDERPPHLLLGDYGDWDSFLRDILRLSLQAGTTPSGLAIDTAWGEANRLAVAHPLAGLPVIGAWLRLPEAPQPGSMVSLRVAAPNYGAVIRMAVSPAEPESGILQMAGGQSGHFLSPNFADLNEDWLSGAATPFLAGPTQSSFSLRPAGH
jgi:penicillin amidase